MNRFIDCKLLEENFVLQWESYYWGVCDQGVEKVSPIKILQGFDKISSFSFSHENLFKIWDGFNRWLFSQ